MANGVSNNSVSPQNGDVPPPDLRPVSYQPPNGLVNLKCVWGHHHPLLPGEVCDCRIIMDWNNMMTRAVD
jgi:hypothetical protein